MPIYLKEATASQEVPLGYFVDSTDGNTEETGLTIANTDIKLWKAGATTLANKNSGGGTHISNGVYYAVLDATDTGTLGSLIIFCHVSGALPVRVECVVLAANVYDSLIGGGDVLTADVTQWTGTNVASPDTAGYPKVTHKVGTGTGEINISSGAVPVTGDLTATMKTSVQTELSTYGALKPTTAGRTLDVTATGGAGVDWGNVENKTTTNDLSGTTVGTVSAVGSGAITDASIAPGAMDDAAFLAAMNAEVVDALSTDTYAEPTSVPGATSSLAAKINWIFMMMHNEVRQSGTTVLVRNNANGNTVGQATVTDNGTSVIRGGFS